MEAEMFAAKRRGAAAEEAQWYRRGLWVPSMLEGNAVDDSAHLAAHPLPADAMGEGGDEEAEEEAEEEWAREDVVHLERIVPQGVVPQHVVTSMSAMMTSSASGALSPHTLSLSASGTLSSLKAELAAFIVKHATHELVAGTRLSPETPGAEGAGRSRVGGQEVVVQGDEVVVGVSSTELIAACMLALMGSANSQKSVFSSFWE